MQIQDRLTCVGESGAVKIFFPNPKLEPRQRHSVSPQLRACPLNASWSPWAPLRKPGSSSETGSRLPRGPTLLLTGGHSAPHSPLSSPIWMNFPSANPWALEASRKEGKVGDPQAFVSGCRDQDPGTTSPGCTFFKGTLHNLFRGQFYLPGGPLGGPWSGG